VVLSWASLGALMVSLGAALRPRNAIGSDKARKQQTLIFIRFCTDFDLLGGLLGEFVWQLGAVLGRSWGLLGHLGNHLERSCVILCHLGGHLGLSEALLEPSWAILAVPTTRETHGFPWLPMAVSRLSHGFSWFAIVLSWLVMCYTHMLQCFRFLTLSGLLKFSSESTTTSLCCFCIFFWFACSILSQARGGLWESLAYV